MLSRYCRWFAASVIGVSLFGAVVAQELPPIVEPSSDGEVNYFDLTRSKDRLTQQIAERYLSLVKLQEWSSAKGTKISAKYVAHDPDLQWVKLAAVKGRGADRVVKEVKVPVEQLSKTCQSRVKQIATLQKKLDELAAATDTTEQGQPDAGEFAGADPGAPMVDERGVEPRVRRGRVERSAAPQERDPQAEAPSSASETSVTEDGDEDPLGFGNLASDVQLPRDGTAVIGDKAIQFRPSRIAHNGASEGNKKDNLASPEDIVAASQVLALLETGHRLPANDKTVLGLSKSLTTIHQFYSELSAKDIAATVNKAHELIKREGKSISMVDVAKLIAEAVPRNQTMDHKFKFSEVTAMLVGLITSGEYDSDYREAALGTRAICEELLEGAKKQ